MAFAAPVLDLLIKNSVTKDTAITRVLIDPRRMRNWGLEIFLVSFEPMIAA